MVAIAITLALLATGCMHGIPYADPIGAASAAGEGELYYEEHEDDRGDVVNTTGGEPAGDAADMVVDIDVVRVSSAPATDGPGGTGILPPDPRKGLTITLSLTVDGVITNSRNHTYSLLVEADDETFMFYYMNGVCIEFFSDDPYLATGAGTDTLVINVTEDDLGDPEDSFGVSGMALYSWEPEDGQSEIFYDTAPEGTGTGEEKPLEVIDPTPGSTHTGVVEVRGVAQGQELELESVEYQVDGTADSGWNLAQSRDNWNTWSFDWDTGGLDDGEHLINLRAKNATETFATAVSFWVDGDLFENPPTIDKPMARLGDGYTTASESHVESGGVSLELELDIDSIVTGLRNLTVGEETIDCLETQIDGDGNGESLGFDIYMELEGHEWLRSEDLALVKTDAWENMSMMGVRIEAHAVETYDPPLEQYIFPMTVGDSWTSRSEYTLEFTTYDPYQGETHDTFTNSVTIHREVLREEEITVPAGEFTCLVIHEERSGDEDSDGEGVDHSLIWYNETVSTAVREISYDADGNEVTREELQKFSEGDGEPVIPDDDDGPTTSDGEDDQMTVLLVVIMVLVAIVVLMVEAMARRRRHRREREEVLGKGPEPVAAGRGRSGDLLSCPSCGKDFDPGDGGRGGGGMMVKCPHCGIEGRLG
jgi:hypothetical protein